jgi:TolB protein
MHPDGTGEAVLTGGPADEGPSWAASSRALLFQRNDRSGRPSLFRIALQGGEPVQIALPQNGSDPDWSGAMD